MFFVQDLSPIHTAIAVRNWFIRHPQIQLLPWPPKGADLNPIENLWADMVRDLNARGSRDRFELFERVEQVWEGYRLGRDEFWEKLAVSIMRRLQLVIENEGYWTGN